MNFMIEIGATELSGESIGGGMLIAARSFFYWINSLIYSIIPTLYNLFIDISNAQFLSSETFEIMTEKVGFLLGIIAMLVVIFDFIKILVSPDKMFDKDSGMLAITKKIIIVLVVLGISGFAFNGLYWFQSYILNNQIIYKLIVPTNGNEEVDPNMFGKVLAARTFTSFYRPTETNITNQEMYKDCQTYQNSLQNGIILNNDYAAGYYCLNATDVAATSTTEGQDVFIMDYNFIFQIAVGIFIIWIFINYIIKVGVRAIQLAVLQIISPFFIIGYLSPKKENLFTKWCKLYFATYLDLFIRCAIIFFVVFISSQLMDAYKSGKATLWESVGNYGTSKNMILIAMILALLTFAKNAPELIKQLLPAGSGTKLGFGLGLKDAFGLNVGASIAAGAVAGGAIGLLSRSPGGFVGGVLKGGASGLKGQGIAKTASGAWKSERDAIKKTSDLRANGGSWFGSKVASVQDRLGMRNAYENDEARIANAQSIIDTYNNAESEAKSEALKNRGNYSMSSFDGGAHTLGELEKLSTNQSLSSAEQYQYGLEYDRLLKAATQFNLDYGAGMENGLASFDNAGNFTEAMSYATGNIYNSNQIDAMSSSDRTNLIGNTNVKIEEGMAKMDGKAKSGRGNRNKNKRNDSSTEIHKLKLSDEYQKHKANAGK